MRHRIYCVFHDPEMQERRMRLAAPIPYEHPEDVQRLLGEVIDAVRRKKLQPRHANTVGYLTTLLMQNQEKVGRAKDSMESAQFYAELAKVMEEVQADRLIRMAEEARERRAEEETEEEEADSSLRLRSGSSTPDPPLAGPDSE
jgi:hypothetical protein